MLRIGMVGAENSHTAAIAKVVNIDKKVPGVRATHVWGETRALARSAAAAGQIPEIVRDPSDMIGHIDAAVVDHRHGKLHLPAAKALLEARIPLFIDKPFCYRVAEGRRFLDRAKRLRVPVCSFSTLPKQESFRKLKKEARKLGKINAIVSTGSCDLKSKYGGIFFYGIHQVDMILRLAGYDVTHAQVNRGRGQNHTATLYYGDGSVVTMNLISGGAAFHMTVIGEKGRVDQAVTFDKSHYLTGIREFCRMFKTGKTTETAETMLGPVAVLEALEKSVNRRGARVKVSS
jgi:predicted dehydrogenase